MSIKKNGQKAKAMNEHFISHPEHLPFLAAFFAASAMPEDRRALFSSSSR
jgi:hypothetical protein